MATKQTITQGTSSVETSHIPFTVIGARLTEIRGLAKASVDTTSLALSLNGEKVSAPLYASLNPETMSNETMITEESSLLSGLGTFINGSISTGNKDESSREPGFDFDTKGITAGADYRFTDNFFLGTAFNYARVDADFQNSPDSVDVDSYDALIYGSYYLDKFYIDGVATYGWNDYDDIRRHIIYNIPSSNDGITPVNQLAKSLTINLYKFIFACFYK